jgi:hypothetical protein
MGNAVLFDAIEYTRPLLAGLILVALATPVDVVY